MTGARDDVAVLCENLAYLRRVAVKENLGDELERCVAQIRRKKDPPERRLRWLLRRLDAPATTRDPLPGRHDWHTSGEVYVCPTGRCPRESPRRSGVAPPECGVLGTELRIERVGR